MSSQSGITASQSLLDSFKQFTLSNRRFFGMRIVGESIEAVNEFDSVGSDCGRSLSHDFDSLHTRLSDTDPMYLVVRRSDVSNGAAYIFISYVPDAARVHDKMIYAASKNTILRNLGSQRFQPILFINSANELSGEGWRQSEISERAAERPLTEAERSLEKMRRDEAVLTGTRKQRLARNEARGVSFAVDAGLKRALDEITAGRNVDGGEGGESGECGSGFLVTALIDGEELKLAAQTTFADIRRNLIKALKSDEPSYNVVLWNGRYFFIYCCPSGSKVRDRMKYAANRLAFSKSIEQTGVELKVIEVGDPDEIEMSVFEAEDMEVKQDELRERGGKVGGLKFAKPRGPRRR
ncbi:hypothetical protein FOA43_002103 [Brettanomyces nanus]|uniref:ADF-H domain-containing protein n=1 Tax=Eeniella nana TaxID=13502 RepID=A0A875S4S4_EENNA|nr:uncharacterized protein FOA43_002103 [Brettanomyces nanus]QPG74769.1 hypothetical protein FOA43_002103 [Brettanomyces nanus]